MRLDQLSQFEADLRSLLDMTKPKRFLGSEELAYVELHNRVALIGSCVIAELRAELNKKATTAVFAPLSGKLTQLKCSRCGTGVIADQSTQQFRHEDCNMDLDHTVYVEGFACSPSALKVAARLDDSGTAVPKHD